ncbi:MAG: nickel/cobalt transporter (NicO) family protein [Thermoleophilaceae bacterium]|nr:nickel/cobalt transporter (NicO) family protein [Thermoleophilaceae bacterium]
MLLLAPASQAHPLGNFTVNHLSRVSIGAHRIDLSYTLDQAEIPTFQERDLAPQAVLARKVAEAQRGLELTVDDRRVALAPEPGARISFPMGQGGLHTTRVEVRFEAPVESPKQVTLHDRTFPGRLGWKAVVVAPGPGTDVRSTVPATDPTRGLRHYPGDLLGSPLDQRVGAFAVRHGSGRVEAPDGTHGSGAEDKSGDGLAGVFADAASGRGVLILLLLAAFGWGALHALSPGHGKSMVAAYLVGTRGTARHAAALGATVTIAHTAGVFALGLVTLGLSQYVLPEDLYPWLTLTSGLLVVVVGIGVLRSRVRKVRAEEHHHHTHDHHDHHHAHEVSWRSLIAMGASAGLIPCPSALVVLLGALSQHQVALGLLLITAFSLGLAATITGIGLTVVYARTFLSKLDIAGTRTASALPALSALVIVAVGCVLTAKAVPGVIG